MVDQAAGLNDHLSSGYGPSSNRPPMTKAEVTIHLEKVINTMTNAVNSRVTDVDFWRNIIDDDFREEASLFYGERRGLKTYLEAQNATTTQWPQFRVESLHIEVDVDTARGIAEATQSGHILGCPPGVQRPWMTNMSWKRIDNNGSWRMISTKSMFGPPVEDLHAGIRTD